MEMNKRSVVIMKGISAISCFLAFSFLTSSLLHAQVAPSEVAISFDGVNSYIDTGVSAADMGIEGDAAKTVEAWVFTRQFDMHRGVFSLGDRATGEDFSLITRDDTDQWRVVFWAMDVDFSHPTDNQWVHLALVYTGDDAVVFANGEEIARDSRGIDTDPDGTFQIGRWRDAGDSYFDGKACEVRVWDRALTGDEIRENMDITISGNEDGLAGYWPLNEAEGDSTENLVTGEDATLHGEASWVLSQPFEQNLEREINTEPGETVTLGPVKLLEPVGEVDYQWYKEDEPIEDAIDDKLVLSDVNFEDLGEYHVTADDDRPLTPAKSSVAILRMPGWTLWEVDLTSGKNVVPGDSLVLGPVKLFNQEGEASYQWYFNNEPIDGATDVRLVIEDISEEEFGSYQVRATDDLRTTPVYSSRVLITRCPRLGY